MSPEQCRGEHVDQRSDLYSLGCTMIECLSGTAPFQADSPIGVLYKHQNQDPGPLCEALPGPLPQSVIKILKQLLAKDARDRQASVDALLLQIQQIDFAACGLQERANVSHPALKLAVPAKIAILLVLLFGAIAVASWLYMKVREDAVSQVRKSASLDAYDVPRDPKLLLNRVKTLRNSNAQMIAGLEMVHAWLEKYGDSPKVTDVDRLMVLSRLTGHGRTEEEFKVAFRSGEKLLKKLGKSPDEILARMSFLSECYPLAHNYNCFVQEIENESAATIKVLQENPLPFALIEPCRNVAAALVSFDRNKEAVQLLEAFLRQYKQSLGYYPSHSTKILSTLADAYVGLGDSEKALAAYRQALESVMQEQKVSLVRALRNPRDFEDSKYIFLAERASFCPSLKEKCTLLSIDFLRQRSGDVPADINSALEVYKVVEETGVNELNAQSFLNGAVWFRKQSAALSKAYLGAFNILSWERAKYLLEQGDIEKGLDEYKFVSEICKKIDDPYSKKRSLEIAEILFKLKQGLAAQKVLKDSGVELSAKWKPDGSTPQQLAYASLPATAYASGNKLLAQETWDKQTANCSSRRVVEICLKDMMRYHESERARRLFIRAATRFAEESSKYPQEHRAKLALLMGRLFLANGDSQSAAFYLRDAKRTFAAMGDSRNFIDRSLPITHCHALLLQCKQKSGDSDLVAK